MTKEVFLQKCKESVYGAIVELITPYGDKGFFFKDLLWPPFIGKYLRDDYVKAIRVKDGVIEGWYKDFWWFALGGSRKDGHAVDYDLLWRLLAEHDELFD